MAKGGRDWLPYALIAAAALFIVGTIVAIALASVMLVAMAESPQRVLWGDISFERPAGFAQLTGSDFEHVKAVAAEGFAMGGTTGAELGLDADKDLLIFKKGNHFVIAARMSNFTVAPVESTAFWMELNGFNATVQGDRMRMTNQAEINGQVGLAEYLWLDCGNYAYVVAHSGKASEMDAETTEQLLASVECNA